MSLIKLVIIGTVLSIVFYILTFFFIKEAFADTIISSTPNREKQYNVQNDLIDNLTTYSMVSCLHADALLLMTSIDKRLTKYVQFIEKRNDNIIPPDSLLCTVDQDTLESLVSGYVWDQDYNESSFKNIISAINSFIKPEEPYSISHLFILLVEEIATFNRKNNIQMTRPQIRKVVYRTLEIFSGDENTRRGTALFLSSVLYPENYMKVENIK